MPAYQGLLSACLSFCLFLNLQAVLYIIRIISLRLVLLYAFIVQMTCSYLLLNLVYHNVMLHFSNNTTAKNMSKNSWQYQNEMEFPMLILRVYV